MKRGFAFPYTTRAITTPRAAPEETPSRKGSARGFLRAYCIVSPDDARPAPSIVAASVLISLYLMIPAFPLIPPVVKKFMMSESVTLW
ncbi:hypothetical protein D1872_327800 [compost metagenome]